MYVYVTPLGLHVEYVRLVYESCGLFRTVWMFVVLSGL